MSFHPSQITSPLESGAQWTKKVRVAGHEFPGDGTDEERIGRLEEAVVAISSAISDLADQVERLGRSG